MSRSGYSDDCGHIELWRSNVERTIRGKRGQAFLEELVAALDAMPEKRLISNELREETGEVCAIGSVGLKRGMDMAQLDPGDPEQVGGAFGISSMLAQEIVYQNDERGYQQTPEERWTRMRAWAAEHLRSRSKVAKGEQC